MFNVDWDLYAFRKLPWYKRLPRFTDMLKAWLRPMKDLNAKFLIYVDDVLYRLAITSQIIYLEKLLNDKFNSGLPARDASSSIGLYDGNPTGIYITDSSDNILPIYLWNKIEQRPKTYLYNKWNYNTFYDIGEFAVYGQYVYRSLALQQHNIPPDEPTAWEQYAEKTYLRNKSETNGLYDFIVHVPSALGDVTTDALLVAQIQSWVKIYLIAGKRYNIVNY